MTLSTRTVPAVEPDSPGLADTGELGAGTLNLETIIDPIGLPTEEVGIRAELDLSSLGASPGRTYHVDTRTGFEPLTG